MFHWGLKEEIEGFVRLLQTIHKRNRPRLVPNKFLGSSGTSITMSQSSAAGLKGSGSYPTGNPTP